MTIKVIWHVAITSLICTATTATTTSNNVNNKPRQEIKTQSSFSDELLGEEGEKEGRR